jgi:hypothetical protein
MPLYSVWSQVYLPEGEADIYTCFLEEMAWRAVHDRLSDAKRIFASLQVGGRMFVCALGHPIRGGGVRETDGEEPLYLPQHLLAQMELEGSGYELSVEWITEEYAPHATKIVLKPRDPIFYQVNARDELEPALTRYGALHAGTTVPVPLEALAGLVVDMEVVRCEPADLVLMEGDEVEIEFAPEDSAAPAATAPIAAAVAEEDITSMLPTVPTAPVLQGNILGGTTRPRLPDGRAWNPWRA